MQAEQEEFNRIRTDNIGLTAANASLNAELDTRLRDSHQALESSRATLISKLDEKVAEISQLEAMVLDLRQSREQTLIAHADEVQALRREVTDVELSAVAGKSAYLEHVDQLNREIADRLEKYDTETKTLELQMAVAADQVVTARVETLALRGCLTDRDRQRNIDNEVITTIKLENARLERELARAHHDAQAARRGHLSSASEPRLANFDITHLQEQAIQASLTGGDDSAVRLRTIEREEIDRLEKIVEVQKSMIDDQRQRIQFWSQVSLSRNSAPDTKSLS